MKLGMLSSSSVMIVLVQDIDNTFTITTNIYVARVTKAEPKVIKHIIYAAASEGCRLVGVS